MKVFKYTSKTILENENYKELLRISDKLYDLGYVSESQKALTLYSSCFSIKKFIEEFESNFERETQDLNFILKNLKEIKK